MFNPYEYEYLGPKRLALLESSWAHLFREEIPHKLPVAVKFFFDTCRVVCAQHIENTQTLFEKIDKSRFL